MRHYFVQHGISVSSDVDETRPLSIDGEKETAAIAKRLHNIGVHISQINHSGKLRARQTADIFATELSFSPGLEHEGMKPNDDAVSFAETILSDGSDEALYVGHLPHMQKVVSYLLTGNENSDTIIFQNSAIVCIETGTANSSLLWYLTPETN